MVKSLLMNFGDNTRVLNNSEGIAKAISPGDALEIDLDEHTHTFISKAMRTHDDPLVLVPLGSVMPPAVTAVMEALVAVNTDAYDELLVKVREVLGAENVEMRPSRGAILAQLRSIAAQFALNAKATNEDIARAAAEAKKAAFDAAHPGLNQIIHDDEDPEELERERDADDARKPKKAVRREDTDDLLGIVSGEELALRQEVPAAEEASKPRKAAKPHQTRRTAKPSPKAKAKAAPLKRIPPLKRIRL